MGPHSLRSQPDLHLILLGHHANEVAEVAAFREHPRLLKWAGQLTLDQIIYCLSEAKLVVSNDTAALHLAHAGKAPVIGLFGPTWAPNYFPTERPRSFALQSSIYCSPCVHHWYPSPCGGDNQCMKKLPWQKLLEISAPLLEIEPTVIQNNLQKLESLEQGLADLTFYPGLHRN